MAPQRSLHAIIAFHVARRLSEAVEAAGLPCTVYADGMSVEVDGTTTYEIASLRHYLIVMANRRTFIHHARDESGAIVTRIVRDGAIRLASPGILLDGVFPPAPPR